MIEHLRAIDDEITYVRKLRHRLQLDRLFEIINQCRARLASATIHDHCANTAYLLKTVHLPHRRSRSITGLSNGVLLNLHQTRNDVEVRPVGYFEFLPVLRRIGICPAPDVDLNGFGRGSRRSRCRLVTGTHELFPFPPASSMGLLCSRALFWRSSGGFFLPLAVVALARLYQPDVNRFIRYDWSFARIFSDGRLQEVFVVAIRKFRLVVSAARFVSIQGAERDHTREFEHVRQVTSVRQGHRCPEI